MISAVLDTNVLWPSLQRDFLLSLAVEDSFRAQWSQVILEELAHHELRKLTSRGHTLTQAKSQSLRLITTMNLAFPDAQITGWEPLAGSFRLPDPDDEHVLAAAVHAKSQFIVTENLRDFPQQLLPQPIAAIPATAFVEHILATNPAAGGRALRELANRYRNPARTIPEIIDLLKSRYQLKFPATMNDLHRGKASGQAGKG